MDPVELKLMEEALLGTDRSSDLSTGPTGEPADITNTLRKGDLIAQVAAETGQRRRDVKPIVEATLSALGAALEGADALNMPPLGKVDVRRREEKGKVTVVTCRVRRPKT